MRAALPISIGLFMGTVSAPGGASAQELAAEAYVAPGPVVDWHWRSSEGPPRLRRIWLRATQLFLPGGPSVPEDDPQYQQALEYYREHAFGPEFLWTCTGTGDAQDEYAGLIRLSDDSFRQATNLIGAVIANHVFSAVDAYQSARGVATPSDVRLVPEYGLRGTRWSAWVSLGVS